MRINKFFLITFLTILVFLVGAYIINLQEFNDPNLIKINGFYSQIEYASKIFKGEIDYNPLFFIHVIRLFIFLPFYYFTDSGFSSLLQASIYMLYCLPIVKFKFNGKRSYAQLAILFFPIFLSYRTSLGICSITYLYLIIVSKKQNYFLLILSLLLANLSSGIMLSWLLCTTLNYRKILLTHKKMILILIIPMIGFMGSLINKYYFMVSSFGQDVNGSALERSTLYVSLVYGQYSRLSCYLLIVLILILILLANLMQKRVCKSMLFFFLSAIPSIFLEGIGLISYVMCFLLFLIGIRSKATSKLTPLKYKVDKTVKYCV